MPRSVLITTSVLVVMAGLFGFWLGQRPVNLDTTGIINAVAMRHVKEYGGGLTDCIGWAGEGASIFRVKCGEVVYQVDRFGAVTKVPEGGL